MKNTIIPQKILDLVRAGGKNYALWRLVVRITLSYIIIRLFMSRDK